MEWKSHFQALESQLHSLSTKKGDVCVVETIHGLGAHATRQTKISSRIEEVGR
jgi:hypothetical protein